MKAFNTLVAAVILTVGAKALAQAPAARPAVPTKALNAIFDAFRSHRIVAIGDDHGNEQIHAFRLAVLRDPRFPTVVNDIVVEFGSAKYQEVIDRFVSGGEVPYDTLRRIWQDTTQPDYEWDLPLYEEFYRAVRDLNATLPRNQHVRVLLGDPPIEWSAVEKEGIVGLDRWVADRDHYASALVRREVLDKGRRALVIYGGGHLVRASTAPAIVDSRTQGLVTQLERDGDQRVFTINPETHRDLPTLFPAARSWAIPTIALLQGTDLGTVGAAYGSPQRQPVTMQEQFDGVLYLGPLVAMTKARLSPALCGDRAYMDMRLTRLAIVPSPPNALMTPATRLKDYCATPNGATAIVDRDPHLTENVRLTIHGVAAGTIDPARIAPESRDRLIPLLNQIGARFLRGTGAVDNLALLADTSEGGTRVRRYRATFTSGFKVLWTVATAPDDLIISMEPRPE